MTKLEERLKEAWEQRKESLPQVSYKSDRENFHAGAKFILELPELKALVDKHEQNANKSNCEYCCSSERSRGVFNQWRNFIGEVGK